MISARTQKILDGLDELFPDAHCELVNHNHFELAVAVVLSAQTTDVSVNRVTPALFETYPTAADLAAADVREIEPFISSLGLYHNKAKSIHDLAVGIHERFHDQVPDNMDDLVSLAGVGRKCANVILSECYGIPSLAVDTHVYRISKRLRLANPDDTVYQVELKLRRKIPEERWIRTHHQMIFFGRYLCYAKKPECARCPFVPLCREKNKNL
ncbi:MAG: endonuclease III [Erysipelotrichia bacterium]|nr:endonuclease III [Erysipelotrichia bacterium]